MGTGRKGWIGGVLGGLAVLLAAVSFAADGTGNQGAKPDAAKPDATKPGAPSPQAVEFFETKVRPLLFEKCFSCHGEKQQSGSLRLDSRAAVIEGGGGGPAIAVGEPDKSRLISAIHYDGKLKMPPAGKLKPEEIATLTQWVKMGAPWPGTTPTLPAANGEYEITPAQQNFWSFRPVHKSIPPKVKLVSWVKSPIDNFILAKLEAKGLKPAPYADRRTLIRRATYDLTGLPPTPEEVDAFLADKSPDAWAKVVDRLLASPRYGERWGRHWLDVARYADTKGYVFTEDAVYHNGYTYRDYVIRAYNEDLPYDQFLIQQLAADRLDLGEDKRPLAALGFLNIGRRFLNDPVLINDDRIDSTCRGMMGLTVACARCHNHKFDPIPAKDYYSLYGIFASAVESNPPLPISPKAISEPYEAQNAKILATEKQEQNLIRAQVNLLRGAVQKAPESLSADVRTTLQSIRTESLPEPNQLKKLTPAFEPAAQQTLKETQQALADLRAHMPPTPEFALASQDAPHPFDPYVFVRGNAGNHGDNVPRRFLQILSGPDRKPYTDSGRLELAQDIAGKQNPLTPRVYVNRMWLYHFGNGIVRTPSDFGTRGEPPTHPELLDWLAATFMEDGWSIKKMQRRMLLSATYQQSSNGDAHAFNVDPENRLLWKQSRQRLDFEALRDSILAVSGKLDTTVGGPAVELTKAPYPTRRTVYGFIDRQNLQGLYRTFDFASPDTSSAQRYNTSVPQQSLFMMNSPFVVEQARALAARPEVTTSTDVAVRIRALYRLMFQRMPTPEEITLGQRFLKGVQEFRSADSPTAPSGRPGSAGVSPASGVKTVDAGGQTPTSILSPWEEYVQTLLLTNEFLFVD